MDNDSENWPNPFPGPVALSPEYPVFGRDQELANLRSLLITEQVVVLHGVSGSGKSSLLRGANGVCERFMAEPGFSVLGPVEFRLPEQPLEGERFYERFLLELLNREEPEQRQRENADLLDELDLEMFLIRRANQVACEHQLLILDQFEDIFTRYPYDEEGKTKFFATLGGAVERDPNLRVLIAMRDEYLGELDHYRRFMPGRFQARLRLELLQKTEAIEAICRTAEHANSAARLCRDDVVNLVDNLSKVVDSSTSEQENRHFVSGAYVEPLFLQLACRDAWAGVVAAHARFTSSRKASEECLPLAHQATREDLDQVLERFYRTVLSEVVEQTGEDEYKLRVFFQDGLISTNGLRNLVSQEQAHDGWGVNPDCLKLLARKHLARPQKRNQIDYIELAHDRLIEPVRQDNDDWFAEGERPWWRWAARQAHLGQGDPQLGYADLRQALRVRSRKPDSLLPYELAFVARKKEEKLNRPLKQVAMMLMAGLTVAILVIAWSDYRINKLDEEIDLANMALSKAKIEIDTAEKKKESLEDDLALLEKDRDRLEKQKRDTEKDRDDLQRQQAESDMRRRIASYAKGKWQERNDQTATMQVIRAKKVLDSDFPGSEGVQFHAPMYTAFNNALTTRKGALGFSRTIPLSDEASGPVAFWGEDRPLMASVAGGCVRITAMRGGEVLASCLIRLNESAISLRFAASGDWLFVQGEKELALAPLPDFNLSGGASGGMGSPKTIPEAVEAYALSDDHLLFAYVREQRVTLLCKSDGTWEPCGRFDLPVGGEDKASVVALSRAVAEGKRRLALGTLSGEVFVTTLEPQATGEDTTPTWGPTGERPKRIGAPRRIYVTEDRKTVVAMRFLPPFQDRLLIVHEDTQIFLDDLQAPRSSNESAVKVIPDFGSRAFGSGPESDNDHYASVAWSPSGDLYGVVDDNIVKWIFPELSAAPPSSDGWQVPVLRYETGSRDLRDLAVGRHFLLARGYFALWAWELSDLRSKLALAKLPGAGVALSGKTGFYPQAVIFSPDGGLITGSTGQGLLQWHRSPTGTWSWQRPGVCRKTLRSVRALALTSNGRVLAAAGAGRQLITVFFDGDKPHLWCDDERHNDGLWSVAFSSDGRWLVSGEWDDTAKKGGGSDKDIVSKLLLWRVRGKGSSGHLEYVDSIPWRGAPVRSVAFHPTRPDILAVGGGWGGVSLYRINSTGKAEELMTVEDTPVLMTEVRQPMGRILGLSFSHDGNLLAAADARGPIHWWRLDFGDGIDARRPGEEQVCMARGEGESAPRPAATLGRDAAKIRVIATCKLKGHGGGARTVRFHPERHLLASGGSDNVLRVWNLDASHSPPAILQGVDADVLDVAWSPEGDTLAAGFKSSGRHYARKEWKHGVVVTMSWNLEQLEQIACKAVWPAAWGDNNPCGQNASAGR